MIDTLAALIARAHQAGFEHRDMHVANILVHPVAPGKYETFFVDLQNVKTDRPLSDRAVVRNLAQLNQWFRRHSSLADRLRFLRRYLRWRNEYEQTYTHGRPLTLTLPQLVRALAGRAEVHAQRLWSKRDRRAQRNSRYYSQVRLAGGWRGAVYLACKRPVGVVGRRLNDADARLVADPTGRSAAPTEGGAGRRVQGIAFCAGRARDARDRRGAAAGDRQAPQAAELAPPDSAARGTVAEHARVAPGQCAVAPRYSHGAAARRGSSGVSGHSSATACC